MMKLYAARDLKLGKYGCPFIMDSDLTAIRSFLLNLADVTRPSIMTQSPEDFELYQIGDYDDVQGRFISNSEGPRFVASIGSCQDEFLAMKNKFIELSNKLSSDNIIKTVKIKCNSVINAVLTDIAESEDLSMYAIVKTKLPAAFIDSGLLTEEEFTYE